MKCTKTLIYNPESPNRSTKLIGGEASGILNWNDIKYPTLYNTREIVRSNFFSTSEYNVTVVDNIPLKTFTTKLKSLIMDIHTQTEWMNEIGTRISDPSVVSIIGTMYDQSQEHIRAITKIIRSNDLDIEESELLSSKYLDEATIFVDIYDVLDIDDTETRNDKLESLMVENIINLSKAKLQLSNELDELMDYIKNNSPDDYSNITDLLYRVYIDVFHHSEFLEQLEIISTGELAGNSTISVPDIKSKIMEDNNVAETSSSSSSANEFIMDL